MNYVCTLYVLTYNFQNQKRHENKNNVTDDGIANGKYSWLCSKQL